MVYLLPIAYVILSGSTKHYDLILAAYIFINIHWAVLKDECIMNYLEKKAKDCEYRLGDRPDEDSIKPDMIIIGTIAVLAVTYIAYKLKLNVPLVLFITIVPRLIISFKLNDPLRIRRIVAPLLGMYVLRNNQYFIPGMIGILVGSCIVKHKDQNSCIRGSQVSEEQPDNKTL